MTSTAPSAAQAQATANPEQQVLAFLEHHPKIQNAQARELTGIGCEIRMKRVFYKLREQGLIEQVAGRRGNKAAWQRVAPKF